MRVFDNAKLSPEACELILKHYWAPDTDNPDELPFIPTFRYVLAVKDSAGNPISTAKLGYRMNPKSPHFRAGVIFQIDNNRKYYSVHFNEEFDEGATYLIEYFDDTVYIIKE